MRLPIWARPRTKIRRQSFMYVSCDEVGVRARNNNIHVCASCSGPVPLLKLYYHYYTVTLAIIIMSLLHNYTAVLNLSSQNFSFSFLMLCICDVASFPGSSPTFCSILYSMCQQQGGEGEQAPCAHDKI